MHSGKLVFAQLTSHQPLSAFRRRESAYGGEHKVKSEPPRTHGGAEFHTRSYSTQHHLAAQP
jgi:hypothetical protein